MKLLLFTVADEMIRLAPPVFVRVSDCVWLLPTMTLPRFMPEGTFK